MPVTHPCGICCKPVGKVHRAIQCDLCQYIKCNHINTEVYQQLITDDSSWCCIKCIKSNLPLMKLSDETMKLTLQGKNIDNANCLLERDQSSLNASFFKDNESINTNNEANDMTNNSFYHSLSGFNNLKIYDNMPTILHLNIASLQLHYDELHTLITTFLGVTGTGLKTQNYHFTFEGFKSVDCFTSSKKGGSRLYIADKFNFKQRSDIKMYKQKQLESVFVEALNKKGKNKIVGCVYKHPNMPINEFNEIYLFKTLELLSLEKK